MDSIILMWTCDGRVEAAEGADHGSAGGGEVQSHPGRRHRFPGAERVLAGTGLVGTVPLGQEPGDRQALAATVMVARVHRMIRMAAMETVILKGRAGGGDCRIGTEAAGTAG